MFENLFKNYQWNQLWHLVHSESADNEALVYKNLLKVCWFENYELITKNYSKFINKADSFLILAYYHLYKGDNDKFLQYKNYLTRKDNFKWAVQWLHIEYVCRTGNENSLLSIIEKSKPNDDLIMQGAILQAWNYRIDTPKIHSKILNKFGSNSLIHKATHGFIIDEKFEYYNKYLHVVELNNIRVNMKLGHVDAALASTEVLINKNLAPNSVAKFYAEGAVSSPTISKNIYENFTRMLESKSMEKENIFAILVIYLIFKFCQSDYKAAYQIIGSNIKYYSEKHPTLDRNTKVYFKYIQLLCVYWQKNNFLYQNEFGDDKIVQVLGESHSLSPNNLRIKINDIYYKFKSKIIIGATMRGLGRNKTGLVKNAFIENLKIYGTSGSNLLITVGEIDCRSNGGIWKYYKKNPGMVLEEIVHITVKDYMRFLYENTDKNCNLIIQGVPAPHYLSCDGFILNSDDKLEFLHMIETVNLSLRSECDKYKWIFFDIYKYTKNEQGEGNGLYVLDNFHMRPDVYENFNLAEI